MPDGSDAMYHRTTRGSASVNLLGGLPDPPPEPSDSETFFIGVDSVSTYTNFLCNHQFVVTALEELLTMDWANPLRYRSIFLYCKLYCLPSECFFSYKLPRGRELHDSELVHFMILLPS